VVKINAAVESCHFLGKKKKKWDLGLSRYDTFDWAWVSIGQSRVSTI
jgi:hypothetical protein